MSSHATKFGVLMSSNWDDFKHISRKKEGLQDKRRPKYSPKQVMDFTTHTIVPWPFQHIYAK